MYLRVRLCGEFDRIDSVLLLIGVYYYYRLLHILGTFRSPLQYHLLPSSELITAGPSILCSWLYCRYRMVPSFHNTAGPFMRCF